MDITVMKDGGNMYANVISNMVKMRFHYHQHLVHTQLKNMVNGKF